MTLEELVLRNINLIRNDKLPMYFRVLQHDGPALSGVYDQRELLAAHIKEYDGVAKGIYFGLNPPDFAVTNELTKGPSVKDVDISHRIRLLFDFDPIRRDANGLKLHDTVGSDGGRISGQDCCSTEAEKDAARKRCADCRAYLMDRGWPAPVVCDSGNGWHLLFCVSIERPLKDGTRADIQGVNLTKVYGRLDALFTDEAVNCDLKVHDPVRISKLYGTLPTKGASTTERPWRRSKLAEVPDDWGVIVTNEQLAKLASEYVAKAGELDEEFVFKDVTEAEFQKQVRWLRDFLKRSSVVCRSGLIKDNRGYKILVRCPYEEQHSMNSGATETAILLERGKGYAFDCRHNHAEARQRGEKLNWEWFRKQVEGQDSWALPEWVDEADTTQKVSDVEQPERDSGAPIPDDNQVAWELAATELDEIRRGKVLAMVPKKPNPRDRAAGKAPEYEEKEVQLPGHVRDENVINFALKTLKTSLRARLFVDGNSYIFIPGEGVYTISSDTDIYHLLGRLRLRINQEDCKLLRDNLRQHTLVYGENTHVQRWGCMKGEAIYVNNGRGGIFKVAVDTITEVPNGTDDVFMLAPELIPWPQLDAGKLTRIGKELEGKGGRIGDTVLCKHLNAFFDAGQLMPSQYQQLVVLRWLSLFLGDAIAIHPLMLATGVQNSGKSTLWEKLMWIQEGTGYESGGLPVKLRDFIAALTNHHVQLFDNIDSADFAKGEYASYLDPICKSVTGGELSMAALYKNNVEVTYDLRCDLFVTACRNPFPSQRSDVSRRVQFFPIRQPKPEEYVTKEDMKAMIASDIPDIKLEILARLQLVLKALLANKNMKYAPVSEQHSYESYTMRVAQYEGWETEMSEIWRGYLAEYQEKLVENSSLVDWVRRWIGLDPNKNVGRTVRTGEMYRDLADKYRERFTSNSWRSSATFGKALQQHLVPLRILSLTSASTHGSHTYRFNPNPAQLEICLEAYSDSLSSSETFSRDEPKWLGEDPMV